MADLPKPHKKPTNGQDRPYDELRREEAIRKARAARSAQKKPTGKERFASDTETISVPPEIYREQEYPENGYRSPENGYRSQENGYRSPESRRPAQGNYRDPESDYGIPDGYDPYEMPRPRRKAPRRNDGYRPPKAAYYDDDYEEPRRPKKRKRRRRHRSSCIGRIIRGAVIFLASIFVLYSGVSLALISRLQKVPDAPRTVTTGSIGNANYTRTILLIGTDSRDLSQERGRSDSMILLTLNDATHEMYMSSLMRDAYVEIPNRGYDKLNAAYSYGGAELLMDTIERNYDVSVDDYICVSFTGFAGIIDAFGGVEITLSDSEANAVNVILQSEVNELMGDDPMADFLPSGGTYNLSGKQALSYARIRYVGNADFERTSRQREVMTQLLRNAKRRAATAVPKLVDSALPRVSTNMNTGELYLLSLRMPFALGYDMRQQQIPADGTWSAADIGGVSVLQIDTNANQALLRDTAYASRRSASEE